MYLIQSICAFTPFCLDINGCPYVDHCKYHVKCGDQIWNMSQALRLGWGDSTYPKLQNAELSWIVHCIKATSKDSKVAIIEAIQVLVVSHFLPQGLPIFAKATGQRLEVST